MSPVQQQRIIGAILLLTMIAGIAFFLMFNASNPDTTSVEIAAKPEKELEYSSVVEAIPEGDIEVIPDDDGEFHIVLDSPEEIELTENVAVEDSNLDKGKQNNSLASLEVELSKASATPKDNTTNKVLWMLQVGSFSVYENALKLKSKLKLAGYESYIEPVKTGSGSRIYRVRIGPDANKNSLEKAASKLKSRYQLQSQIIQKSN